MKSAMAKMSAALVVICVIAASLLWSRHREVAPKAVSATTQHDEIAVTADGRTSVPVPRREPRTTADSGAMVQDGGARPFRTVVDRVMCHVSDAGAINCGSCKVHEDCPQDQACIINRKTLLLECTPGDCKQDTDCTADKVCRAQVEDGSVKQCVSPGDRYDGDRCNAYATDPRKQCQDGLVCVNGFCGTPCDKSNPKTCREGTVCADTREGPACERDSCLKIGCPTGEKCLTIGSAKPHCYQNSIGDNCFVSGCPKGEDCVVGEGIYEDSVAFQCKKTCDPLKAGTCPKGYVCGKGTGEASGACYKHCDPPHGLKCDEKKQEICATVDETMSLYGCIKSPDGWRSVKAN